MKLKHIIKKEYGQAMVEFALVLPILILLIGGIIDFGWIFNNKLIANNACREGARHAAIHHDVNATQSIVASYIRYIAADDVDVTPAEDLSSSTNVTVSVDYSVPILTPVLMSIVGEDFNITAAVTMKVENYD